MRLTLLLALALLATACHHERRPQIVNDTHVVEVPVPKARPGQCPDPAQVYKPNSKVKLPEGCH